MDRKPKKIELTEKKFDYYTKIVVLITAVVSLIVGVLTMVDKCAQRSTPIETPGNEHEQPPPEEKEPDPPVVVPPDKEPESQPKPLPSSQTEYIKLSVTTTSIASASAFDDDIQITLTKVHDAYHQVFGKIKVNSVGESLSFEEWTIDDLQKKIGNYEINIKEIGHDYAEFRIVRRQ